MKQHPQHNYRKHLGSPSCANCIHTFRHNSNKELVVCVPHLKTMPAEHSDVCELHVPRPLNT
jgi:hypothetical protein